MSGNMFHISCFDPTNRARSHQRYVKRFPSPKLFFKTARLNKTAGFCDWEITASKSATFDTWISFSPIGGNTSLRSTLGQLPLVGAWHFHRHSSWPSKPDPTWPFDPKRQRRNWSYGMISGMPDLQNSLSTSFLASRPREYSLDERYVFNLSSILYSPLTLRARFVFFPSSTPSTTWLFLQIHRCWSNL